MTDNKPYTIKIFAPTGNPGHIKIIDKLNWTGVGIELDRSQWKLERSRDEFGRSGVYILIGYDQSEDKPTIYIGQGETVRDRIDSHADKKDFWTRCLVFAANNGGLNRAHITWLEYALVAKAKKFDRCYLDNGNTPNESLLSESDKADTEVFLDEILSILPLVDLKVFEKPEKIVAVGSVVATKAIEDTVVVPAQEEGFKEVFLGKDAWYAIRIAGGRLDQIKYIAAYQTSPVSAVTHYAPVKSIEPYGDGKKYRLNFSEPATAITPLEIADAPKSLMQNSRYTNFEKLMAAKNMKDLFY